MTRRPRTKTGQWLMCLECITMTKGPVGVKKMQCKQCNNQLEPCGTYEETMEDDNGSNE